MSAGLTDCGRLAKWWGLRHGYIGREGGWVYKKREDGDDIAICQGWEAFFQRNRRKIARSGDRPSKGRIALVFDQVYEEVTDA
jgi:hypothetical protein